MHPSSSKPLAEPAGDAGARRHAMTGAGRIHFWQGGVLWIGRGQGSTDWHEHHAHQLTLALDGELRFRTQRDGPWDEYRGALIPSHRQHQFQIDGARIAHLFVEPESRAGRSLVERFGADGIRPLRDDSTSAAVRILRDALDAALGGDAMVDAARRALALLCGTPVDASLAFDPRLARAMAHIRTQVRAPVTLADGAAAAHLSESRFRHLFVAETGSSFRAWLLWLRINIAIEAAMAGATWTEAAHEAGFSDSAHLTRTHRRMFGIEPTSIRPT